MFTGNGIIIDGVKLYRENNKVILEGNYSEEYFNVRKLLYDFLKITWNITLNILNILNSIAEGIIFNFEIYLQD